MNDDDNAENINKKNIEDRKSGRKGKSKRPFEPSKSVVKQTTIVDISTGYNNKAFLPFFAYSRPRSVECILAIVAARFVQAVQFRFTYSLDTVAVENVEYKIDEEDNYNKNNHPDPNAIAKNEEKSSLPATHQMKQQQQQKIK